MSPVSNRTAQENDVDASDMAEGNVVRVERYPVLQGAVLGMDVRTREGDLLREARETDAED